jgi:CheY-like chemotaxis protein
MMLVLVVDDEADIQLLFKQQFRKEIRGGTIEFRFAFGGDEALALLGGDLGTDLVLILSDINMPGMSGLDLLRAIRIDRPDLPVFMITAYDDASTYDEAMESGANDYIAKPIDFQALKEKILAIRNSA